MALLRDCSAKDVEFLCDFDNMIARVSVYDPVEMGVSNVDTSAVAWQAIWLLTRHNLKHRYVGAKLPSISSALEKIREFENKLKWRWTFRHNAEEQPKFFIKTKTVCNEVVDSGLQYWLRLLRKSTIDGVMRARRVAASCREMWMNRNPIVLEGLRWLKTSRFRPVATDKTKSWVLVDRDDYNVMLTKIHSRPEYRRTLFTAGDERILRAKYVKLATRIGQFEGDSTMKEVLKS